MKKIFSFILGILLLTGLPSNAINVEASNKNELKNIAIEKVSLKEVENFEHKIIYADTSNREEVLEKAQSIFDQYGSSIVVEVRDYKELSSSQITNSTRATGKWVSNYRSYFIGHITYATDGTIKCYVSGSKVSKCSGSVTVYGNGPKFAGKALYKTTSKSAYMNWYVQVGDKISGITTLGYSVPLYK